MKKMFLVLFMILALSGVAFADSPSGGDATATANVASGNTMNGQGATMSILSPTATGGSASVGAITNTNTATGGAGGQGGTGGSVIGSGNSSNLNINAPSASATIQKGAITNTVSPTISPTNTNTNTFNPTNTNTIKDVGNVTIGGGILSKTLSPEANASANVNNVNVNKPTFNNANTQGQIQGQKQQQSQSQSQGQSQSSVNTNTVSPTITANPVNTQAQNNAQTISPKQVVLFESPTPLLVSPSQNVPELNFGNGRMIDATKLLPNFAIYGIKPLGSEPIREVLNVNANVKFKRLYQAVLDDAKDVANGGKKTLTDVRYQVIRAEGQKSWTTGGNLGGAGSALSSSGLSGASGAGSIIPQWGGTKADDLFTIIFVRVVL